MTFLTKVLAVGGLLFSTLANAVEYREVQADYSEQYTIVITNQECTKGKSTDGSIKLFKALVRDKIHNAQVDEGCWYPQQETIIVAFPPTQDYPDGVTLQINANHFYLAPTL